MIWRGLPPPPPNPPRVPTAWSTECALSCSSPWCAQNGRFVPLDCMSSNLTANQWKPLFFGYCIFQAWLGSARHGNPDYADLEAVKWARRIDLVKAGLKVIWSVNRVVKLSIAVAAATATQVYFSFTLSHFLYQSSLLVANWQDSSLDIVDNDVVDDHVDKNQWQQIEPALRGRATDRQLTNSPFFSLSGQ